MRKSVKKVLAAAIVLCLAFAMTACSGGNKSNSKYVGTWKATSMEMGGASVDPTQYGMEMTFEFKTDGKVTISMTGENPEDATWEEKDGGVEIKDSKETVTGKIENEKLVIEIEGIKFTLEKQ